MSSRKTLKGLSFTISSEQDYHDNEEEILEKARAELGYEIESCSVIALPVNAIPYIGQSHLWFPEDATIYLSIDKLDYIYKVFLFRPKLNGKINF
ncbi:hypothetical protein HYW74_04625 [Candidatus Pacearchaeota archaeon]|nr:hypothetical protein [Candidatus Pacearchaeota archaeon]